jgi:hypothetical protein
VSSATSDSRSCLTRRLSSTESVRGLIAASAKFRYSRSFTESPSSTATQRSAVSRNGWSISRTFFQRSSLCFTTSISVLASASMFMFSSITSRRAAVSWSPMSKVACFASASERSGREFLRVSPRAGSCRSAGDDRGIKWFLNGDARQP